MAGVLQTGAFVNGEWISESLDINTVLKRNETKQAPDLPRQDKPQEYGLLSQTVIESPIIRWILPVNIRGSEGDRDVAFISDNIVQIRYLDEKGQLQDIARKSDFGSRIRNARIVGSVTLGTESSDHLMDPHNANVDAPMEDVWAPKSVEYIVLALESGVIVFLFASTKGTNMELVATQHTVSRPMLSEQPGRHIAVDPSSQYMAVGGAENVFAVYALRSVDPLSFSNDRRPVPLVESERYFHIDGVIHKMEFLYPSADDPNHIILLLLVVYRGTTRMFVYDWVAGQKLRDIRNNFKKGTIVLRQHRMPLLLIPLRIRSAVLLVSDGIMAVCTGILEGTPTYTEMDIKFVKASPLYLGSKPDAPLWTSWFRPLRTYHYSKAHDDLYLAREDGAVLFIENSTDYFVQAQMDMYVDCNIDTAFACLDKAEENQKPGDGILVGGDSCNGGLYLVEARYPPVLLSRLSNWSPMIDFVVTNKTSRQQQTSSHFVTIGVPQVAKPEQIFALTGRGTQYGNALSEMRYGHEAHLRVESELGIPIGDAWYLPFDLSQHELDSSYIPSTLMLLSVANESLLLGLAVDDSSIEEIEQNRTWLDLTSRTITAAACGGVIIQVTERSVIVSAASALNASPKDIYRRVYPAVNPIIAAYVFENELVLTVHTDGEKDGALFLYATTIHLGLRHDQLTSPMVNCMEDMIRLETFPNIVSAMKRNDGITYDVLWNPDFREQEGVISALGTDLSSFVNIFQVEVNRHKTGMAYRQVNIKGFKPNNGLKLPEPLGLELPNACISLVCLKTVHRKSVLLLAGHRDGLLIMVHCKSDADGQLRLLKRPSLYTIGSVSVVINVDIESPNVALISCDSKIWRVSFDDRLYSDPVLNRIWFTDIDDPYVLQPYVSQVCKSPQGLLLVSKSKILVAVLDPDLNPRAIPRPILLPGHPSRLVFDEILGVLVVVVETNSESAKQKFLALLDPETGAEIAISWPQHAATLSQKDHARRSSPFFSDDESVLCLCTIGDNEHPGSSVIIAGLRNQITGAGALVVYYLSRVPHSGNGNPSPEENIICTRREFLEFKRPVYAVVALQTVVLFCVGEEIRCVELLTHDMSTVHKCDPVLDLPSPAVSMSITAGFWLNVHTAKHSLLTYKFSANIGNLLQEEQLAWTPQFADEIDRDGLDHIVLTDNPSPTASHLVMISDKACSVAGLSYAQSLEPLAQNQHTLFEAELSASILKFGRGNTRPPWDISWKGAETRHTATCLHGTEVVGITIDGSLRHFTVLNEAVYKLLYLLQDRARQIEAVTSSTPYQPVYWRSDPDPMIKHIDGDFLRKLLHRDCLEHLLGVDESSDEEDDGDGAGDENVRELQTRAFVKEFYFLLMNTLEEARREAFAKSAREGEGNLFELCREETYRLLERLLRPVL